jgi:hypothetical protein
VSRRRRWLAAALAAALILGAVIAAAWMFTAGSGGSDEGLVGRANIVAALAALVTLLAMLGGVFRWAAPPRSAATPDRPQLDVAADELAEVMAGFWREQVRRRRIVTPAPARVRWQWAASDIAAPRAHVITPPAPGAGPATSAPTGSDTEGMVLSSGVVTRLHEEVYQRLPHRLLVILGDPGAGKTAAMILLLLAALDPRSRLTGEQRRRTPVPVWLTLGGWNPATTPLHAWARNTLNRDHPYLRAAEHGPDAAGRLLRVGRVALFLDGLDEMSEDARGRALDRLREEAAGLWAVITSRTGQYREAIAAGQLDNAAVIELRPVRAPRRRRLPPARPDRATARPLAAGLRLPGRASRRRARADAEHAANPVFGPCDLPA